MQHLHSVTSHRTNGSLPAHSSVLLLLLNLLAFLQTFPQKHTKIRMRCQWPFFLLLLLSLPTSWSSFISCLPACVFLASALRAVASAAMLSAQPIFWSPHCLEEWSVILQFSRRWWRNSFHANDNAFLNWKEHRQCSFTKLISLNFEFKSLDMLKVIIQGSQLHVAWIKYFLLLVLKSWCSSNFSA